MPLPSFLKAKDKKPAARRPAVPAASAAASAADEVGAVQLARLRARRRLIGAVVLLAVGVIGFPLLFETQPRPVAVDIAIEVPQKGLVTAPASNSPATPAPAARAPVAPAPGSEILVETAADAGAPVVASAPSPARPPEAKLETRPEAKVEAKVEAKAEPRPEPKSEAKADPRAGEAARAKALLDDASASAPKTARFVVQVGAYNDANTLREARQKVEKLGLKTYTQVIEGDAGKRTRVRVGPFDSRSDADSTAAKLKAAGLPVAVLTL